MKWTSLLVVCALMCCLQFHRCQSRAVKNNRRSLHDAATPHNIRYRRSSVAPEQNNRRYEPPKVTFKVPLLGSDYKISSILVNVHVPHHKDKQHLHNHTPKYEHHSTHGDLPSTLVERRPENEHKTRMSDDSTSNEYEVADIDEYNLNNDYEGNEEYDDTSYDTENYDSIDPRFESESSEMEAFIVEDTTVILEVEKIEDSNNLLFSASYCGDEADIEVVTDAINENTHAHKKIVAEGHLGSSGDNSNDFTITSITTKTENKHENHISTTPAINSNIVSTTNNTTIIPDTEKSPENINHISKSKESGDDFTLTTVIEIDSDDKINEMSTEKAESNKETFYEQNLKSKPIQHHGVEVEKATKAQSDTDAENNSKTNKPDTMLLKSDDEVITENKNSSITELVNEFENNDTNILTNNELEKVLNKNDLLTDAFEVEEGLGLKEDNFEASIKADADIFVKKENNNDFDNINLNTKPENNLKNVENEPIEPVKHSFDDSGLIHKGQSDSNVIKDTSESTLKENNNLKSTVETIIETEVIVDTLDEEAENNKEEGLKITGGSGLDNKNDGIDEFESITESKAEIEKDILNKDDDRKVNLPEPGIEVNTKISDGEAGENPKKENYNDSEIRNETDIDGEIESGLDENSEADQNAEKKDIPYDDNYPEPITEVETKIVESENKSNGSFEKVIQDAIEHDSN